MFFLKISKTTFTQLWFNTDFDQQQIKQNIPDNFKNQENQIHIKENWLMFTGKIKVVRNIKKLMK